MNNAQHFPNEIIKLKLPFLSIAGASTLTGLFV